MDPNQSTAHQVYYLDLSGMIWYVLFLKITQIIGVLSDSFTSNSCRYVHQPNVEFLKQNHFWRFQVVNTSGRLR